MTSRRTFLTAVGGAALAGACGVTPSRDPNGPLTFWSSLRGTQTVVEAWNKKYPKDPVALDMITSGFAGGNAKLANAARAGNAPDVVSMAEADLPSFALDGVCADLTEMVSASLRDLMGPRPWDHATLGGRIYGVPLDLGPMLFVYREDILRAGKIDVPTTWDEFRDAARALKRASGVNLTTFHPNAYNVLAGHAMQSNGQWFAVDGDSWVLNFLDQGTRRVAGYWQGLIDEKLLLIAPGSSQEWAAAMANGSVASYIVGAWGLASVVSAVPKAAGKWRAAALPQWDPAKPMVGRDGASLHVITADSAKKDRAMRFVEWMSTSPDAITARLSSGRSSLFPAAESLWEPAAKQFRTDYYAGQNVYGLVAEQYRLLRTGWTWGPRMQSTAASLHHGLARLPYGATITEALAASESETLPDMRSLGLSVRRG